MEQYFHEFFLHKIKTMHAHLFTLLIKYLVFIDPLLYTKNSEELFNTLLHLLS